MLLSGNVAYFKNLFFKISCDVVYFWQCVESPRGSYTRLLDDEEVVLDIQDRWHDNEGYFKLCRKPSKQEEDENRKNGMLFEENALDSVLTGKPRHIAHIIVI